MSTRILHLQSLGIGVLLGFCFMAIAAQSSGQSPAAAPYPRYQIDANYNASGDLAELVILDHQTNMIYHRTIKADQIPREGRSVENIISAR